MKLPSQVYDETRDYRENLIIGLRNIVRHAGTCNLLPVTDLTKEEKDEFKLAEEAVLALGSERKGVSCAYMKAREEFYKHPDEKNLEKLTAEETKYVQNAQIVLNRLAVKEDDLQNIAGTIRGLHYDTGKLQEYYLKEYDDKAPSLRVETEIKSGLNENRRELSDIVTWIKNASKTVEAGSYIR